MAGDVYQLQNITIHTARQQLEAAGVLKRYDALDDLRHMAGEINDGINSISKLSLRQRHELIARLIGMGATVRNPVLYVSDLRAEAVQTGKKRKILTFSSVSEKELRMMDSLAASIAWNHADGFARLCQKIIKAPRPRQRKEVTAICAALRSMIKKQEATYAGTPGVGPGSSNIKIRR